MGKKKTQPKKKVEIKAEKAIIETPKAKSIDWSKVDDKVIIIAGNHRHMEEGKEYQVTKEIAKILVEKNAAKLK